jgi:hypothetical protein
MSAGDVGSTADALFRLIGGERLEEIYRVPTKLVVRDPRRSRSARNFRRPGFFRLQAEEIRQ